MKRQRTNHLLALGVLLLMPSCVANAATYCVDAVNGNDANPGSSTAPWKTLSKAANAMASGDTAFVRAAMYRETVHPKSGQRFEADGSAKPLITGCDPVSGWTVHSGSIY